MVVASFETSCAMNEEQLKQYYELNRLFNKLSTNRLNYSPCSKRNFLLRVEEFINAKNN